MSVLGGNASLRLASLLLAAGLWFVIAGRQTAERGVTVPVEFRNVPHDLETTGDAVNTVDVRVRASPGLIDSLDVGKLLATVDLAGASEGERIVQLTPVMIQVPYGFRVIKITPSLLTLNLERTQRKAVPVRPRLIGRPAPGFEVAEIVSAPAEVRLAGPRSRVQEIESAFTEPVSIEGLDRTRTGLVNVGLEDPLLRLEEGSRVAVTVNVREARETRTFEGLPVVAQGRPVRLDPPRVAVTVSGPASRIRALEASHLTARVSLPDSGPLPSRLPVAVDVASGHVGVSVVETRPAEVSVRRRRSGGAP
ncbi:MAG TPA: CdaR family protein [Vicinamibacteria bacterium]|nr:CdaR family protein [Vicinamibacteria bacterium]